MKKIIISTIYLIFTFNVFSQMGRVLVQNSPRNTNEINIKWYSQQFIYPEGVTIYRRIQNSNDWQKLNSVPIKIQTSLPIDEYKNDANLEMFVELIRQVKPEQLVSFVLINVMGESFISPVFCRYAGIQYDDKEIINGTSYEYQVRKIVNGVEELLATSDPITAGEFKPLDAPLDFFVKAGNKQVKLGWLYDNKQFFANNIYRQKSGENEFIKINKNPVVLSKVRDSVGKMSYPVTKFVNDSLKPGLVYTYKISGLDYFGNESKYTSPVSALLKDKDPPSPPANLTRQVQKMQVTIHWENTESFDLKGFNVYRGLDNNTFEKVNSELLNANSVMYIDKAPVVGNYYYYIGAVDNSDNTSKSFSILAEVADVFPPQRPTELVAKADTGKIILEWKSNNEEDLMGYAIFRRIKKSTVDFSLINSHYSKQNKYVDSIPRNVKNAFEYKIQAIDSSYNRSPFSEIVAAKMPDIVGPDKPFIKSISIVNNETVVEWIPNADADLAGYHVYRSEMADSIVKTEKINAKMIHPTINRFTDHWIKTGAKYYYHLSAVDSSLNESAHSDIYSIVIPSINTTNKMTIKLSKAVYKHRKKMVILEWDTDGKAAMKGFVVYRKNNTTSEFKPMSGLINENNFNDKQVAIGDHWIYQVRVYLEDGSVLNSNEVMVGVVE